MALPALIPLMVQGGRFALPRILGMGKEFIAKQGGLPYLTSGSRALTLRKNTLPAVISGGRSGLPAVRPLSSAVPSGAGSSVKPMQGPILPGSSVPSGVGGAGSLTVPGLNRNLITATGINLAGAGLLAPSLMEQEAEISTNQEGDGGPVDTVPDPVRPKDKKKDKDDKTTSTDDQIKKGDLDSFINDRIGLFEKYIGDDSRKRTKSAAYNAMVQFGLNLASSKDPNLLKAIAESAKDPMKEFAALGNKLMDRAESIKKAGIESGVAAYDKAQDREVDREAIAADILKEKIKQDAKTLSRGEFITATMESIAGNQTLVDAITSVKYDKDGLLIEGAPSDAALIQKYAEDQYDIYRAVEIPSGSAGDELYESLPSGSRYYDQQTGTYGTKP
jgi:hypothetical protein